MRKQLLAFALLFLCTASFLLTSCSRRVRGGSWYRGRNHVTTSPAEKAIVYMEVYKNQEDECISSD